MIRRADASVPATVDPRDISAQALHLHALGLMITTLSRSDGLISRREADLIAERCGAVVSELTDAGLWVETDVSYIVRVGALFRTGGGQGRIRALEGSEARPSI